MTAPVPQYAFTAGEVSPALFGRYDLARMHLACSTMRNFFPAFRGGAYSRGGTAFVGFSKQTGRAYPPRMIGFQFNVNQGLALEFGNFYMRVVEDGAFVTENPLGITNISKTNPAVVTFSTGASGATPGNPVTITASYAPADTVTLAGGTFTTAAVLLVNTTALVSLALTGIGTGQAPGDVIQLVGGTQTVPAEISVTTTTVSAAAVHTGGSNPGVPNGNHVVTGVTGTGTKFQANCTFVSGVITAVVSVTNSGSYTANPTNPAAEPVQIGGSTLVGATLSLTIGISTFSIFSPGVFTVNPPGGNFTQGSTTGHGTGATFGTAIMGPHTLSVSVPGAYTVFPGNPVGQASSSGAGLGATFVVSGGGANAANNGDWFFLQNVNGMTQVNGQTYVAGSVTASTFALFDVYGNPIDGTGFSNYVSGGTASRIFTLPTIYSEQDLLWLKLTQSADVMSLCCVNQISGQEYPPQDLDRLSDTSWNFSPVVPAPSVSPPASVSLATSTAGSVNYAYEVTSVSPIDGSESIASPIGKIGSAVALSAGTITVTWTPIAGVEEYHIYRATPTGQAIPDGSLFGLVGAAYGVQFTDTNIVADFTQVPPNHENPFARGQIVSAQVQNSTGTVTSVTFTINTGTGSGAVLQAVIDATAHTLDAIIVKDGGQGYLPTDTVTVNVTGGGSATATLNVGPESGTYPSVPGYFQERRVYANTLNNPDTYFMSQPGAFTNFDTRIPTIDSDAITGSPWAVEVNGIQWLEQTSGGLLVLTGLSAWLLAGTGSFATNVNPIAPANQTAVPQAFSGCSASVPPIRINYDVLYVNSKGSRYFDLPYQLYALSEPIDITVNSDHLFAPYTILQNAWCEEPNKLLWAVRSDGILLCDVWYKSEQINGWSRHDTQGLFQSVCSVTEPPVDAPYLAVQRFPGTNTCYMIERMDNRIWNTVEDAWCVDAGLRLPQPTPNAYLSASSRRGLGACTGVTGLVGGSNYSAATTATVTDINPNTRAQGQGTGAAPILTIVAGVITAITFPGGSQGTNYTYPELNIYDPTNAGSGASARITLSNTMTFTASNGTPFALGNVGNVIRAGGGIAVITGFTSPTVVTANMLVPITQVIPGSGGIPQTQPPGAWTMTAPVNTATGLNHLIGATVTGLADGNVIPPTVVSAQGTIALPAPTSPNVTGSTAVTIGLGFLPQLQSVYLDTGSNPSEQGQRKKIADVVARIQASRGMQIGTNQPDGSTLSPPQVEVGWQNLDFIPDDGPNFPLAPYNALCTPLRTGDSQIVPVQGGWRMPGQVCVQQPSPLPAQLLAFITGAVPGDSPDVKATPRKERGK